MTQVADRDLVREASTLIDAVAGRAQAMVDRLTSCRDAVQASTWRHVGPHRAAENLRRLDAACEEARWFLDATAGPAASGTNGGIDCMANACLDERPF